jgi:hypothetical protein
MSEIILHGLGDDDLRSAIEYHIGSELPESNIAGIVAEVPGDADGPNWHWLVLTKDGRFAYAHGGCDYTGWA